MSLLVAEHEAGCLRRQYHRLDVPGLCATEKAKTPYVDSDVTVSCADPDVVTGMDGLIGMTAASTPRTGVRVESRVDAANPGAPNLAWAGPSASSVTR